MPIAAATAAAAMVLRGYAIKTLNRARLQGRIEPIDIFIDIQRTSVHDSV
jgi:hypothetical protein